MSNIDNSSLAKTRELATLMVERTSMNPVSCKLLNEAWKKEFPDEVAIAERMLALLDKLEVATDACNGWQRKFAEADERLQAAEKRIAELSASHGNLREAMAGIHNTITAGGAYTPLAAILNSSKRAYEESAAAAGKGEAT
ncbi:TPA: hypothetical protein ACNOH3_000335 [Enterobacter hormaechei]